VGDVTPIVVEDEFLLVDMHEVGNGVPRPSGTLVGFEGNYTASPSTPAPPSCRNGWWICPVNFAVSDDF
jgi:hypothetical protein